VGEGDAARDGILRRVVGREGEEEGDV